MNNELTYKFVFDTRLENYYGQVAGVKLSDGRYGLHLEDHSTAQIKIIPEDVFKSLHDFFGDDLYAWRRGGEISVDKYTHIEES